jgi:hypothetical protein
VDREADLRVALKVNAASAVSWGVRGLILLGTFALLCAFAWMKQSFRTARA